MFSFAKNLFTTLFTTADIRRIIAGKAAWIGAGHQSQCLGGAALCNCPICQNYDIKFPADIQAVVLKSGKQVAVPVESCQSVGARLFNSFAGDDGIYGKTHCYFR